MRAILKCRLEAMKLGSIPWKLRRRVQIMLRLPDRFLRDVRGVIHVGANDGRERHVYAKHGLRVLWVEPIPEVFAALKANIAAFPNQRAVRYLVTDADGVECELHVANNKGLSSSILDLKEHRAIWPDVTFSHTLKMRSTTLDSLIRDEGIDVNDYDALVMDTQGSELLVLKGARRALRRFRYVKTEVADFESYAGCCQVKDIESFLAACGYRESVRVKFAAHPDGGAYYDIVYRRAD